jgi:hypothetical protein
VRPILPRKRHEIRAELRQQQQRLEV